MLFLLLLLLLLDALDTHNFNGHPDIAYTNTFSELLISKVSNKNVIANTIVLSEQCYPLQVRYTLSTCLTTALINARIFVKVKRLLRQ